MFGAYQAGVWESIAGWFRPDIVVGASIGALNGWAIAGGCSAEELTERWSDLGELAKWRMRAPWRMTGGLLDSSPFEDSVRQMYARFRPGVRYGVVVTDVRRMKAELFTDDIGWEHLAASCSVPLLLQPRRIGGRMYTDGGLLDALPLWAAAELGAEKILAVQVLPCMPSAVIRTCVKGFRAMVRREPPPACSAQVIVLGPEQPLGRPREMLEWQRERSLRWMELGRREADEKKQLLQEMF